MTAAYVDGEFGITWHGQTHAMQRVLCGFDDELLVEIENEFARRERPELVSFDWNRFRCKVECEYLTIQEAVDFACFLIGVQSGVARFGTGVPTAGDQTRIGVVTRRGGIRVLSAPEIFPVFEEFNP